MDPSQILAGIGGGTGLEVAGILMQGNAEKKAANYNAAILESNADQATREAGAREEAQRRDAAFQLGRQRAAIAQSGGGFGGSAADVMRQSASLAELDALNIRYEGDLRRRGLLAEAGMSRWQGKMAKKASYLKATTTLVKGATDYGSAGVSMGVF